MSSAQKMSTNPAAQQFELYQRVLQSSQSLRRPPAATIANVTMR